MHNAYSFTINKAYSLYFSTMQQRVNALAIQRLTALWGLCECGLGGWLHALRIPLTGFLVGGFAVVIIGLIAHFSNNSFRHIIQSTILVLLIKAAVSPHSPWPAYVAVSFQGLMGAVLYFLIRNYTLASVLLCVITMLESGLQKLIMMTIVFGKSIWVALDSLFNGIVKSYNLPEMSFSFWLIAIYTLVYALWGLIVGLWSATLPKKIEQNTETYTQKLTLYTNDQPSIAGSKRKTKRWKKLAYLLAILSFIVSVYLFGNISNGGNKAFYVILRTIAVLLLFFGIINPIIKWLIQRWIAGGNSKYKKQLQPLLELLPELRSYVKPAYSMAAVEYKGIRKYSKFLLILIILTLQPVPHDTK